MPEVSVQVQVPAGLKAIGDVLLSIAVDAKAGKTAAQIAVDVVPALAEAGGALSELAADVKDPQVYAWAGLFAGQLAQALIAAKA